MPIHCGVDGSVKTLKGLYCGVGGAVKEIVEVYCGTDSGIKKLYDGRKPLVLYDSGNQYTNITGGWQQSKLRSQYEHNYYEIFFRLQTDQIYMEASAGYHLSKYLGACTISPIDVTRYKKLCVTFNSISYNSTNSGPALSIGAFTGVEARVAGGAYEITNTLKSHYMELDISNVNTSVYIDVGASLLGFSNPDITLRVAVKKIWLEP